MAKNAKKILELENEFFKKKPVNGKRKGAAFERAIAKKFNEKFNTKDFCRTPGSGAFATTHTLPDYLKIHGDLVTPETFSFIIECKSGYDVTFDDIFKPKSDLFTFIAQAKRDAIAGNKDWLLIYKKTRKKEIVVCERNLGIKNHMLLDGTYYFYTLADVLLLEDSVFFE